MRQGVYTGILFSVEPFGVWEPVSIPEEVPSDLLVRREPWGIAQADLDLAWSLVQKDVEKGHIFPLPRGEAEARSRWGASLAAGKLGVVKASGKKLRLVGDGSISGSHSRSRFLTWKLCSVSLVLLSPAVSGLL